ncbi:hypothetical protein QAD02_012252 [Eretmocerus hayati]|uniref:Uncharacterized protein n=1 Tax=Eretmocerus hayati TaxID=131215 RepID=A0ACC2NYV1_9HYME|nr:hypothetical protein QAD02_012252 [Eretmocerus hayati]
MESGVYDVGNSSSVSNSSEFHHVGLDANEIWMEYYGAVRDPLYVVIPISILYASIFVTGTIGNVSTCIVIARNKSMHTATNYYLFSLAVSDLLLLMCGMPAEIYQVWSKYPYVFGETFCVLRGLAAETSSNASVLTITAFTAERYVAICHPFLSHTMSKLSRAVKLILFIWLVALLCAIPQALQFGLMQITTRPSDVMCSITKIIVQHSFELSTFIFFVVPMSLIMVLYILIGLKLKKSTALKRSARPQPQYYNHNHHGHHHHLHRRPDGTRVSLGSSRIDRHCRHSRSTRRVLKMLVPYYLPYAYYKICYKIRIEPQVTKYFSKNFDHENDFLRSKEATQVINLFLPCMLCYCTSQFGKPIFETVRNKYFGCFGD